MFLPSFQLTILLSASFLEGMTDVTLEMILIFFTGASSVPVLGWPTKPELHFSSTNLLPTASTCALELVLPTAHYNKYEDFKNFMCQGV